jgi:rhodanese-related sulfurtransferase
MVCSITREQLQARLASSHPPLLLEALPAKYFQEGHLPGAVHFPHDNVRTLAGRFVPDKQTEVVVYCASDTCRNSHRAAETLVSLGYAAVSVYAGGKKDWSEAGLPLERGGTTQAAA